MLNQQQQKCLNCLKTFLESKEKFYLINGEAGSGKTYLIQNIIKELDNKSIGIAAPTNKACRVLESRIKNPLISIQTIHRMMGLTMKQVEEKQILTKNLFSFSTFEDFNLVLVDEGSMIDSEIFTMISNKLNSVLGENTKVIFLADEAQIQPVKEKRSPIFNIKNRSDLTEIVRQAKNSPLMPLIQATRQLALGSKRIKFDEFLINNISNDDGVWIYPYEKWMNQIIKSLSSNNYQNDPFNHSKIITWRNRVSDKLGQKVRFCLNKKNIETYEAGDLIYIKEPVMHPYDENVILIQNCTELEVLQAEVFDYSILGQPIKAWKLKVWNANNEEHTSQMINVVDPVYINAYQALMLELIDKAKEWIRENPDNDSSRGWREFYKHKRHFALVSYLHTITVRRSQGSEWENVFIWLPDLMASQDWSHLYTAFTRSKKRLIIGV